VVSCNALRRPDRDVLKHAGAARDRHQDHHAGEQTERVPVDPAHRFGLIDHADQDHQRGAEQRHDRAVELVPDDRRVGREQDRRRHRHRIEAEDDVRDERLVNHDQQ